MVQQFPNKSSVEEIRRRFDHDVERFSDLECGQEAAMDAPQMMAMVSEAAAACNPSAQNLLDIGCGAGNYTLRILQHIDSLNCDLVDLSRPMLDRAVQRISRTCNGTVRKFQGDIRTVELPRANYHIIVAAAVLHHLRDENDWHRTFEKLFSLCAPGGSIWIADLVKHGSHSVEQIMEKRYCKYLESIGGSHYRDRVLEVIAKEDSPQTLTFQIELLKKVGFSKIEILHKNACYAAFGATKPLRSPQEPA